MFFIQQISLIPILPVLWAPVKYISTSSKPFATQIQDNLLQYPSFPTLRNARNSFEKIIAAHHLFSNMLNNSQYYFATNFVFIIHSPSWHSFKIMHCTLQFISHTFPFILLTSFLFWLHPHRCCLTPSHSSPTIIEPFPYF